VPEGRPATGLTAAPVDELTRELILVGRGVIVNRDANLLEVVAALQTCGGLADLLDGGEQQADQDRDDRDDDQQLDQRETTLDTGQELEHVAPPATTRSMRGIQMTHRMRTSHAPGEKTRSQS
jgi:hypothetical protein